MSVRHEITPFEDLRDASYERTARKNSGKDIDTHVAGMLVNVASALRLLGAETVLTGIAPRIAQTLVSLNVDLRAFVTRGTLQSGMDFAFQRVRGAAIQHGRRGLLR